MLELSQGVLMVFGMTSLYFDENCSVDVSDDTIALRGRFSYANLQSLEAILKKILLKDSEVRHIDFSALESFDSALVVLLCRLRAIVIKQQGPNTNWVLPNKLSELLVLYGLKEYF